MKYRSTRRTSRASDRLGLLAIATAVLGAGCSDILGPRQEELAAARARWADVGPQNYLFDLQRFCFCGSDFLRAVQIRVQGGVVVSAIYVDTQEPIEEPLSSVPTIEDLFDEIQEAIDAEAFSLDVAYNEALGFPTDVSIDFDQMIIDEEMAFQVRNLSPLVLNVVRAPSQ